MFDHLLDRLAIQTGWLLLPVLALGLLAGGLTVRTVLTAGPPAPAPLRITAEAAHSLAAPGAPPTPQPAAIPTPIPTLAVRAPTATPAPAQWQGRAVTDAIIREEPSTKALPSGLLLRGETTFIDDLVTGEAVERENGAWYRVHSGVMAGYVYGPLLEPGLRPDTPAGRAPD